MEFEEKHKESLGIICQASVNGDLGLALCQDRETGNTVTVLVARAQLEGGGLVLIPLAKMFEGLPSDELFPPDGAAEEPSSSDKIH